jgi:hypothetical protein
MRNGFLFSTARAAALASIVGAPLVVISDAQRAQAASRGDQPGMDPTHGPDAPRDPFVDFLDEFWQDTWGEDFVPHQSGMMFEQSPVDGPRVVLAHGASGLVGQGLYEELDRFLVPWQSPVPVDLPADASFSFERFVTAGVIQGPTGYATPLYGLAQRVVFAPGDEAPIVVEAITPLDVTDTPDEAVAGALQTLGLLGGGAGGGGGASDDERRYESDLEPCPCDEVFANEFDACVAVATACDAACAAVALAGIIACLALGPLAGPCMAAVLTAQVLCMAACFARQRACKLRATNSWLLCVLDCES